MRRLKQSLFFILLIVLSIGLWQVAHYRGLLDGFEQEALRWRYLVRGEKESAAPIVFVDLDSKTVARIGDKPWDRKIFGQVIGALLDPGGARVVGLDVILSGIGAGSLLDFDRARAGICTLAEWWRTIRIESFWPVRIPVQRWNGWCCL